MTTVVQGLGRLEGFPQACRLKESDTFKRLFKEGKRRAVPGLTLISLKNDLSVSRLGFVIPKRSIRSACQRNRLRRIIVEFFRKHVKSHPNQPVCCDHLFWVRKDPGQLDDSSFMRKQCLVLFKPFLP